MDESKGVAPMEIVEKVEEEEGAALVAAFARAEASASVPSRDVDTCAAAFRAILGDSDQTERGNKVKGNCLIALCKLFAGATPIREEAVLGMLDEAKPFFALVTKARTAKLVRQMLDAAGTVPGTHSLQERMCQACIAWATAQKRTYLRQRMQARLAALVYKSHKYQDALDITQQLVREVKKLDDKQLMVEICLVESAIHHALRNMPKAKAALTAGRTNANAIYVPPKLQAEIDMQAGTLQADDRDYRTAYSYFLEGFEGFHNIKDGTRAAACLKFMLLCKIMQGKANEVSLVTSSKNALKYRGPGVDAMTAVAHAYQERSLHELEAALAAHEAQLKGDRLVETHLELLKERLLEENLVRIIEPYSRVEISRVAELINLPVERVQSKLAFMLLDKKFAGTLDQGRGHLLVFEDPVKADPAYTIGMDVVKQMNGVVDSLFRRAEKLNEA